MFSSCIKYILLTAAAAMCVTSCSDEISLPDYVTAGEDMTIRVALTVDNSTAQSRADLSETQLNTVQSLWVATFSAGGAGEMTSKTSLDSKETGWVKFTPGTNDKEVPHSIEIVTKSGPSYIVAVANVEKHGVLRDAPGEPQPLSELLEGVKSWADFLKVGVVAPSTYEGINAPETPMAMSGAYTNAVAVGHEPNATDPSQWQNENVKPYTIPKTNNGIFSLTDGAIHLRRPVSQINFSIKSGNDNVRIVPNSYQVINVPDFAWLYERPANAQEGLTANFGDDCTEENKGSYYTDSRNYSASSSFIRREADGSYSFNFWQAENKHTGTINMTGSAEEIYKARDAQASASDGSASGVFTALCPGGTWTPNNMASYVLVNCNVDYVDPIYVNEKGEVVAANGTDVWRSGSATYLIHLGYMGGNASDFNCYRNVRYHYDITVNGLNDIRVEAYKEGDTPGAEGVVTDVMNPTVNLDCHYAAFNIQLTDAELSPWQETENGASYTGFGFMIMTYDNLNGGLKEYDEVGLLKQYASWDDIPADIQKYVNWVEFRPTSGETVLAAYKPRTGDNADGLTFNLYDASKGITNAQKSTSTDNGNGRWYTCFVNEYTYEAANANEAMSATGGKEPLWYSYVNADPRRFYIRVTRTISNDGESVYARSKYAVVQNSIQTYYGRQAIPEGTGRVKGAAMGFESVNEVYGLNMRRSWTTGSNPDNGRYNCWLWASGKQWSACVDQTAIQTIPTGQNGITATSYNVPKAANYTGTFTNGNTIRSYDPQPSQGNGNQYLTANQARAIEAINACMNRNRDNNGNTTIDASELRWYVPGLNQYTRITLGANSLGSNALMNYTDITNAGGYSGNNFGFGYDGKYLYYSSDGRVFWAMEGYSTGNWNSSSSGEPVAPWQVRCIRNLGTNLGVVNSTSQAVKAYTYTTTGTYHRVVPTYYELTNTRTISYSGNGDEDGEMPVHVMYDSDYNAVYRGGFEILSGHDLVKNDGDTDVSHWLEYIAGDPCSTITDANGQPYDGGRWRLPNATELAIMQNEGEFTSSSTYYLSCTALGFNGSNGNKITNSQINSQSNLLSALSNLITRSPRGNYNIRCVRDIIE